FYNKDNNLMPAFVDPIMAYKLPTNFPAYTPEGKLYYRDEYDNPYAWMLSKHKSNSNNLVANLTLKYTLMKGLDLKVSGGYNRIEMVQTITRPRPVLGGSSNLAIYTNNNNQSLILEPQISYTRSFGRSKVDFVGGGSYQESRFVMPYYIFATNYASDELLENVSSAGRINSITNSQSLYRYASGFGRLTYNWDDKYILNGVFRRDGSSRFAPGKQFGNFGSIGLAWVFSNEAFISSTLPWLSYGKIRGSYGSTGNDQITDYGYLDTYGPSVYPYGPTAGMMPTRVANPEFSWEVTKKLEAALELGFAKDRFMFTLNYFRNRSDNMLVGTPLTPQTGFSEFQSNFPALVQNKGIEIELNVKTMQKTAFSWNTSFNLTSLRNELASFPGLAESGFRDMYLIGQPLSMIALYEYAGLKDGIPEVTDKDGDKTPVPGLAGNGGGDLIAAGQTAPYFYGGFNNTLSYRNWSFDIFFQFVKQDGLHPRSSDPYMVPGLAFNQDAHMLRDGLRPTVNAGSPAYVAYEAYARSTAMLQDASYIRLKNLAISYNLKSAWLNEKGIDACRFFLRGQNLLTFTGYYGFDPETKALTLPPLKTATIGIQVTL
ncbi:SusC/RagA family TonB-linked outer membrane protein, partial [uncultured Chitinophaga sp.]|uniref:SusC/RagA family TonB-linked outer membrane protein n=1 Tax=uncultured Chitinophaga sp. TaxID=339340 RepID=UPI00261FF593